jgi:hypothetical protein
LNVKFESGERGAEVCILSQAWRGFAHRLQMWKCHGFIKKETKMRVGNAYTTDAKMVVFRLSAHGCRVPTPTSQNLEVEQQIRILESTKTKTCKCL